MSAALVESALARKRRFELVGVPVLLRVSLRQDVRNIAPWIAIISVLSASSILAYAWIFPDAADRQELASTIGVNPALSLIFGPARDLMTADGFNAWRAGQLGAFFAGLMAILIVIRNSRGQEDSGQAELIASGVVSRQTRLAVAILMAWVASVVLAVVSFLVTVACGGGLLPSALLAGSFAVSGVMFAGVAAIAAQVGSDARSASSFAVGTLGVTYLIRGYLDASAAADWTTWLTPFGWLSAIAPATDNNPWPLLLGVGFAGATVLVAFALQARRDFGQGLIATRPGAAEAGLVGTIWGLGLRIHRGALVTWIIAFAVLGFVFGNLATSLGDVMAENPALAAVLASGKANTASITFAFLATILQIIAIIAAVMGVQIVLRVYDEESQYRVEPLLATSLRRTAYLVSNVVIALVATAVAMTLAGLCLGLVASAADDTLELGDIVWQSVVTVPAVWLLVALAVAAVGAAPSRRIVAWLGVVATFGLTILGPTFNLWQWALDISPLRHIPTVTDAAPQWSGLAWLAAITIVLLAVGFVGFRRRDVL